MWPRVRVVIENLGRQTLEKDIKASRMTNTQKPKKSKNGTTEHVSAVAILYTLIRQVLGSNLSMNTFFLSCPRLLVVSLSICMKITRVPGYRTDMYCVSCEVRTEFMYVM
jgi:hypothetical protein